MCVTVRWDLTRHAWISSVQAQQDGVLVVTGTANVMVRGKWPTAQAAMKAVDAEMERYIQRKIVAQSGLAVVHA
jgi:hypothetical protein